MSIGYGRDLPIFLYWELVHPDDTPSNGVAAGTFVSDDFVHYPEPSLQANTLQLLLATSNPVQFEYYRAVHVYNCLCALGYYTDTGHWSEYLDHL